jgi:hypothetical protein
MGMVVDQLIDIGTVSERYMGARLHLTHAQCTYLGKEDGHGDDQLIDGADSTAQRHRRNLG